MPLKKAGDLLVVELQRGSRAKISKKTQYESICLCEAILSESFLLKKTAEYQSK